MLAPKLSKKSLSRVKSWLEVLLDVGSSSRTGPNLIESKEKLILALLRWWKWVFQLMSSLSCGAVRFPESESTIVRIFNSNT